MQSEVATYSCQFSIVCCPVGRRTAAFCQRSCSPCGRDWRTKCRVPCDSWSTVRLYVSLIETLRLVATNVSQAAGRQCLVAAAVPAAIGRNIEWQTDARQLHTALLFHERNDQPACRSRLQPKAAEGDISRFLRSSAADAVRRQQPPRLSAVRCPAASVARTLKFALLLFPPSCGT